MRVDLGRHDCVSECVKSSLLETDNVDISRSGRNGSSSSISRIFVLLLMVW